MSDQNTSTEGANQRGSRIDPFRHLVGVLTDSEVAAKAGVSSSAVHQYRNRLGIAPALPPGTTRRAMDRRKAREASGGGRRGRALLTGKEADDAIALHVDQLGRAADRTVAAQIGVTRDSVQAFREKLGIAAFPEPAAAEPAPARSKRPKSRKGRSKLDPYRDLVGVLSDSEVAKRAGVTRSAVQMYRRTHGIPAASPPGGNRVVGELTPGPAAPRPIAAGASAARGGRNYAWMVRFSTPTGEQSRVAVAPDAASACSAAGTVGEVIGVERLAEALG
ncbi:MAG: hypothetical protein R3F59_32305 [Myxococcota bacterium]